MLSRAKFFSALGALVMALPLMFNPLPADAYNTFNDHTLFSGVNGRVYWIGPAAEDHHEAAIVEGVKNWNQADGVAVQFSRTDDRLAGVINFVRQEDNDAFCAVTEMFAGYDEVNPNRSDWTWAKVTIRPQLKNENECGPAGHRQGIIAHEVGHAMGLAHVGSGGRLMYRLISQISINNPQQDDKNGINYLY